MANGNEENVEDMMLIAVHEVADEVPSVDGRSNNAKQCIATSGAKPSRRETEVGYVSRIASTMFGGSEARHFRSSRRGNGREMDVI